MTEDVVVLNVGGALYTTTKSTLCRFSDSMLGAMFSGGMSTTTDTNGHYFIDRDGEVFRHVLNFLRSTRLSLPVDFNELDLLSTEADFYQIQPLISAIQKVKDQMSMRETYFVEIIEVRTGSTATMPTNNSRIKTILSGRKDVIVALPCALIGKEGLEKLQTNHSPPRTAIEFVEIELNGSNIRLKVGEYLKNQGWELVDSQMTSSSGYDAKALMSCLIIEQSYRDRWSVSRQHSNTFEHMDEFPISI